MTEKQRSKAEKNYVEGKKALEPYKGMSREQFLRMSPEEQKKQKELFQEFLKRSHIYEAERQQQMRAGPSLEQLQQKSRQSERDFADLKEGFARGMMGIAKQEQIDAQEMALDLDRPLEADATDAEAIQRTPELGAKNEAEKLQMRVLVLFTDLYKAYDQDVSEGAMTRHDAEEGIKEALAMKGELFRWVSTEKSRGNYEAVIPKLKEYELWLEGQLNG